MYEYLAAGMPILCSDLDAFLEEYVEPGAAFAVDPNDVDDIERGLRLLVQERKRLPAMSEKAAWLARNRFNWETQERRLLELYDSLARADS
jgi:glycosyltransferase involved in cell wall biosynthesis